MELPRKQMAPAGQSPWAGEVNRGPNWGPAWPEERGGGKGGPSVSGATMAPSAGGPMQSAPGQNPAWQIAPAQGAGPMPESDWVDLRHNLPTEVIDAPLSREEAHLGSLKAMLTKNVGTYIVARFLVGTQNMVSCEGILFDVGNDYLIIYQEGRDRYIVSDYFSLKFVEFYEVGHRHCHSSIQEGSWPAMMT